MENQTDYEKAKDEAWRAYSSEFGVQGSIPNVAFSRIFDFGYNAGKAHAADHTPEAAKKVDRTMIAAMAMQGILSNPTMMVEISQTAKRLLTTETAEPKAEDVSELAINTATAAAVRYADSLIAELKKEGK